MRFSYISNTTWELQERVWLKAITQNPKPFHTCGWRQLSWSIGRCVGSWGDVDVVVVGGGGTWRTWCWTGSKSNTWRRTWLQTLVLVLMGLESRILPDGTPMKESSSWETFSSKLIYQWKTEKKGQCWNWWNFHFYVPCCPCNEYIFQGMSSIRCKNPNLWLFV